MFRNYFTIALRNIRRHRAHSALNIVGLSVALAACIIIFLVLQHEFSYDTYHKNADRVHQVVRKDVYPDGEQFDYGMPFPTAKALRNDYPTIEFPELFTSYGSQVTVMADSNTNSNKKFIESRPGLIFCEPEVFDLFDVTWLSGNKSILSQPGKAVIARSEAIKYFGDWKTAIGKFLKIENAILVEVAGIIEDVPLNSDFPFKVVPSYKTFLAHKSIYSYLGDLENWGASSSNHQVYALLPTTITKTQFDQQLKGFVTKYYTDPKQTSKKTIFLHPLKEVHFDTRFGNNGDHVSSKASLITLSFIGLLVILMACINFINLSTALAVKRSKEVGIRKVMGSSKLQLKAQVYFETGMIVLFAALLGSGLAWLCLPYLKFIADIQEPLQLLNKGSVLFVLTVIAATTLLSGFYPSIVMSRFQPVEAIKNKISTTSVGGISLRRILVILQFAFSQLLIIATIIAVSQMDFIRKADLGLNKEAVLMLTGNSDSTALARQKGFKADLQQIPGVQTVSFSMDAPSSDNTWTSNFAYDNNSTDLDFNVNIKMGDEEYAKAFGLQMAAGQFYPAADSTPEYVVNETLVKKVGIKDPKDAIGKMIRVGGGSWVPIYGVVKDFKNKSLRDEVKPTVIMNNKQFESNTNIKIRTSNLLVVNEAIQKTWDKHFPEFAYNSIWLDESINNFYRQEERLSRLYKVYAGLAIFISCLGLYGLVSFMAVQKTKEVGIRKVLGASISSIIYLFSKEFTILVLLAFAIAAPSAWFLMNKWLDNFVFKINIGLGVFLLAIAASIGIAWLTVGYKAIRAALANPVKSLRSE